MLQQAIKEYDKVQRQNGDYDNILKEAQERGAMPTPCTIKDLVEDMRDNLRYNYSDPTWRELERETEEGRKEIADEVRRIKNFIKKWEKIAQ